MAFHARWIGQVALAWSLVAPALSGAQDGGPPFPFADDFEAATPNPSTLGVWSFTVDDACPGGTCSPSHNMQAIPAAAHRGNFGVRSLDTNDPGPVQGDSNYINTSYGTPFDTIFGRFWMRVTSGSDAGMFRFAIEQNTTAGTDPCAAWLEYAPLPTLGLGTEGFSTVSFSSTTLDAGWHLFELSATGLGTVDGGCVLFMDGERVISKAFDYSAQQVTGWPLGEATAWDSTWMGTLDYDDVRFDRVPLASRLEVTMPDGAVGDCLPVTVTLVDSVASAPAVAPYDVVASLVASAGEGSLFSDPACSIPVSTTTLTTGSSTAALFFRPTQPGKLLLTVSHPDFLVGSLNATIAEDPDAGSRATDGGPASMGPPYRVGCSSAPASPVLFLLVLVALRAAPTPDRSRSLDR